MSWLAQTRRAKSSSFQDTCTIICSISFLASSPCLSFSCLLVHRQNFAQLRANALIILSGAASTKLPFVAYRPSLDFFPSESKLSANQLDSIHQVYTNRLLPFASPASTQRRATGAVQLRPHPSSLLHLRSESTAVHRKKLLNRHFPADNSLVRRRRRRRCFCRYFVFVG